MRYNKQQPQSIKTLFNNIAPRYDWGNTLLSLGLHHLWNRHLIHETLLSQRPCTYLDLCCGTGAISLNYLQRKGTSPCHAYLIDFSEQMLDIARQRAANTPKSIHTIDILQGDAMAIPLDDKSVEAVTIAYGIRNVADPATVLEEVFRILKPGGLVGILELTRPENIFLKQLHGLYLHTFVPLVGKLVTSNQEAYQYLKQSIKVFIKPEELVILGKKAGFKEVKITALSGGIATQIMMRK